MLKVGAGSQDMASFSDDRHTKNGVSRKTTSKAIAAYAGAVTLCLLMLVWVMRLWRADLAVPLDPRSEDLLFVGMLIKGLVDNGWYWFNRFLGMPFGLELHDFPTGIHLQLVLLKLVTYWTHNHAMILNLFFLLTFPLTTLSSLCVFRSFKVSYPAAIVGSLLFSFLPYHFSHGEYHIFVASYYPVPLMVMVCLWVCLGEPLFPWEKDNRKPARSWVGPKATVSIVICVLVGSGGAYYAFFGGFFLLVAGLSTFFRERYSAQLLTAGVLLGVLFLAFVVHVSPSLMYAYHYGRNMTVVNRESAEAEFYGMKITQLVLPVSGHRVPYLARLKAKYNSGGVRVLTHGNNDSASLGAAGSFGFLVLIGWLLCGRRDVRHGELFISLAVLNIFAVLLGTIGGLGALFAFLVSPVLRLYSFISIYIAFFSLFAVVLLLDNLAHRCMKTKARAYMCYGLLGLILLFGTLDQTSPHFVQPPYEQIKAGYTNDASFVASIENSMPEQAMIFQLPYVPFPENAPVHRMEDYDLFRGYLHSKTLRWSYGAMKGRPGDIWQAKVVAQPPQKLVETLAFAGFSGIYLDRYGYQDQGAALEAELHNLLAVKPIASANRRLIFFDMTNYNNRLRGQYTAEEWRLKRDAALHPLTVEWKGGFSSLEADAEQDWRWSSSHGELYINNPSQQAKKVILEMSFVTSDKDYSYLDIDSRWFSERLQVNADGRFLSKTVTIEPGKHVIRFVSDGKRIIAPRDPRVLVFRIRNFRLKELE